MQKAKVLKALLKRQVTSTKSLLIKMGRREYVSLAIFHISENSDTAKIDKS